MIILLTATGYIQLITLLIVFVLILFVTAWITKWIGNQQRAQSVNSNIEVIETMRISVNKYVQVVRVGTKYIAIAVCKDTITMLCEIPEEQVKLRESSSGAIHFRDLFQTILNKDSGDQSETKEKDE